MRSTYVADAGDGLCMAICTISGKVVQIDCGGQEGSQVAFNGLKRIFYHFNRPDVFILSHFHIDHYNGLLYASTRYHRHPPVFRIREVFYPRIPQFKEKEKFLLCLLALNLRVFGSETGVMEYDFLRAISRINRGPFKYKPLCKGDIVNINGSAFRVLWPPSVVEDDTTLSVIKRALEDFEEAMEEDEETKQLYDHVREEGIFRVYLGEQGEKGEFEEYNERGIREEYERRELPEVVKNANKSLREAANHLSLALFEDNRFLFLGDTENFEIRQIVDDLKSKGRKNFYIFITPHHGTHWDNCLEEIKCIYSISSNGKKLGPKMVPNFKKTSRIPLSTFVNKDIVIPIYPIYPKRKLWRVFPGWFYK